MGFVIALGARAAGWQGSKQQLWRRASEQSIVLSSAGVHGLGMV